MAGLRSELLCAVLAVTVQRLLIPDCQGSPRLHSKTRDIGQTEIN